MSKKTDLILAEALVEKGLINQEQMDALFNEADVSAEGGLQAILLKKGIISEKDILIVLAGELRLPYVQLKELTVEKSVLNKISLKVATYYGFIPLNISGRVLTIAVSSPLDIKIRDEIRIQLGYEIEIALAEQSDIADTFENWDNIGAEMSKGVVASAPPKEAVREEKTISWTATNPSQSQFGKDKKLLGEILIERGLLTSEQLALALGEQSTTKELLGVILVRKGWVKEKDFLTALSQRFNLPLVELKSKRIDWEIFRYFSSSLIFDYRCVPFERDEHSVTMAISNPLDAWTVKRAEEEAKGLILKMALTSREDIDDTIKQYQLYMLQKLKKSLK